LPGGSQFRAALDNINESGFSAAAYLKNALNRLYYVGGIPNGEVNSFNEAVVGEPHRFYVEVSYKF
jgi:hypothetical protein